MSSTPKGSDPVSATIYAPLSLRKNLSWTFLGYAVYVLCQWGMVVVLAKLLSPAEVGRFALGLAIAAPVVLFANLGLRPLLATDARNQYAFSDYLGLRLVTTAFALLAILGVTWLAGYPRETALVVIVVGMAKCLEAVGDIFYGMLQHRERMDRISKSMIIKGLFSLAALAGAVYLMDSVIWGSLGLVVAWALVLIGYDLKSISRVVGRVPFPRWEARTLKQLVFVSLPLGISVVLISLNANVPRYLVEHYLGERELGIFAAMAYPLVAGATVIGALGQSASPRLAKHYHERDYRAFRALLAKLAGLGAVLGAVGLLVAAVAGKQILTIVYTPEYAESLNVFLLLMLGAGITYVASFLGFGMTAARLLRPQVPLFLGVISVTVLLGVVLVPRIGMIGAAVAFAVGMFIQVVGSAGILAFATRAGESE